MSQRISSRLAEKQEKQIVRQSTFMILAAIAIGVLFIFVILPFVIKLFFSLVDSSLNKQVVDDIPPQVPVLMAPVEATYSASLKLSGYGEAKSEAVFVLNSVEVAKIPIQDDGSFLYELELEAGDNLLSVYGIDAAGNESLSTKDYVITQDNTPPEIKNLNPEDGAKIELRKNQVINLKGETEPGSKVYVNGRLTYANTNGMFSTQFKLDEGDNEIEIKVIDKAGNTNIQKIKINFRY